MSSFNTNSLPPSKRRRIVREVVDQVLPQLTGYQTDPQTALNTTNIAGNTDAIDNIQPTDLTELETKTAALESKTAYIDALTSEAATSVQGKLTTQELMTEHPSVNGASSQVLPGRVTVGNGIEKQIVLNTNTPTGPYLSVRNFDTFGNLRLNGADASLEMGFDNTGTSIQLYGEDARGVFEGGNGESVQMSGTTGQIVATGSVRGLEMEIKDPGTNVITLVGEELKDYGTRIDILESKHNGDATFNNNVNVDGNVVIEGNLEVKGELITGAVIPAYITLLRSWAQLAFPLTLRYEPSDPALYFSSSTKGFNFEGDFLLNFLDGPLLDTTYPGLAYPPRYRPLNQEQVQFSKSSPLIDGNQLFNFPFTWGASTTYDPKRLTVLQVYHGPDAGQTVHFTINATLFLYQIPQSQNEIQISLHRKEGTLPPLNTSGDDPSLNRRASFLIFPSWDVDLGEQTNRDVCNSYPISFEHVEYLPSTTNRYTSYWLDMTTRFSLSAVLGNLSIIVKTFN